MPYTKIIEAWLEGVSLEQNRHNTLVELASHLRYLIGKNAKKIEEVVMQLPWVKDLAAEGENVSSTIGSVIEFKYRENMPKRLKEALEKVGANHGDIYAQLPLDKWAEELQEMEKYYPCMKELFLNAHPHKNDCCNCAHEHLLCIEILCCHNFNFLNVYTLLLSVSSVSF